MGYQKLSFAGLNMHFIYVIFGFIYINVYFCRHQKGEISIEDSFLLAGFRNKSTWWVLTKLKLKLKQVQGRFRSIFSAIWLTARNITFFEGILHLYEILFFGGYFAVSLIIFNHNCYQQALKILCIFIYILFIELICVALMDIIWHN